MRKAQFDRQPGKGPKCFGVGVLPDFRDGENRSMRRSLTKRLPVRQVHWAILVGTHYLGCVCTRLLVSGTGSTGPLGSVIVRYGSVGAAPLVHPSRSLPQPGTRSSTTYLFWPGRFKVRALAALNHQTQKRYTTLQANGHPEAVRSCSLGNCVLQSSMAGRLLVR